MMLLVVHDGSGECKLFTITEPELVKLFRKCNGCSWNGKGSDVPEVTELFNKTQGSGVISGLPEYEQGQPISEVVTFYEE